jgi:hypothetical protein
MLSIHRSVSDNTWRMNGYVSTSARCRHKFSFPDSGVLAEPSLAQRSHALVLRPDSGPSAVRHRSQANVHSIHDDRGFGSDLQLLTIQSIATFCFLRLVLRQSSPSLSISFAAHVAALLVWAAVIILSQPYSQPEEGNKVRNGCLSPGSQAESQHRVCHGK